MPGNRIHSVDKAYVDILKYLISKGELEKSINQFVELTEKISPDLHNNAILQSGRYWNARKRNDDGTISESSYDLTINRVRVAVLNLINKISEDEQLRASRSTLGQGIESLKTASPGIFEKVFGPTFDLFEINWLQKAIRASKSVCKVKTDEGSGTGFLLNGGYLITNQHVLTNISDVQAAKVIFNYQFDVDGESEKTSSYGLDASTYIFSHSSKLDYAIAKVIDPDDSLSDWRYLRLHTKEDSKDKEKVNIIQHPGGNEKKIALPDSIIGIRKQYLHYMVDTEVGSSGSPIFNQKWKVIGLHHAGKDQGTMFEINEDGDEEYCNRGILINRILDDITDQTGNEDLKNLFLGNP